MGPCPPTDECPTLQTVFEKAKMRYSEETWEEKIDAITIYTFANTRGLGLKPDGVWLALPRSNTLKFTLYLGFCVRGGREASAPSMPHVKHKPLLRERGATCSLPEVGGGVRCP